jgi:hypothetical protein
MIFQAIARRQQSSMALLVAGAAGVVPLIGSTVALARPTG